MIPPAVVYIRKGRLALPIPVIVLWPLFLLAVLVLPFVPVKGTTPFQRVRAIFAGLRLLSALRGLRVDTQTQDGKRVLVAIW
jgi:hypothetical protein